ncbi:MAG: hypothetical protein E7314_08010 [Clostridiales bacterium]|nr:hypothetical protein [Clostridiales bacterium]
MNAKLKNIFDLQTSILLNHVLSALLKFFLNGDITEMYLYECIIPTREITKADLRQTNRNIPRTFKYEVWITFCENKISFILKSENCSEIEIYNYIPTNPYPKVSTLKNISNILVTNYRPIPTKIDIEFSELSKKYSNCFNYSNVKRNWNSGYTPKYSSRKGMIRIPSKELNEIYDCFYSDLNALAIKYKVISKILIDIYITNTTNIYVNASNSYQVEISHSKGYGISFKLMCICENFHYNQTIPLLDFYYNNKIFKKNAYLYDIIVSCVRPTLTKT